METVIIISMLAVVVNVVFIVGGGTEGLAIVGLLPAAMFRMLPMVIRTMSVSYTHLDVYKRQALVVGGSGLLGGEISYAFAELGAELIVASRNEVRCADFVDTLRQQLPGVVAHTLGVDITEPASISTLMDRVREITGGGLDILVNSGWSGRKNTFESISDEDWNNDIEVCPVSYTHLISYGLRSLSICWTIYIATDY